MGVGADPAFTAPTALTDEHDIATFACGQPVLDDWLRQRAAANDASGASRTYVLCVGRTVIGYYSLAAGATGREDAPGRLRRNMPDPIPVMVLGRLAIEGAYQGRGLGSALLRDATLRTLRAAEIAGIRAIVVHALDEPARAFYLRAGFLPFPGEPLTLCLPLETARRALPDDA